MSLKTLLKLIQIFCKTFLIPFQFHMAFKAPKTGVKVKWSKVNVRRVGKSLLPLIIVLAHIISLTELSNRLLLTLFFWKFVHIIRITTVKVLISLDGLTDLLNNLSPPLLYLLKNLPPFLKGGEIVK